jgi:hypothetical protein
MYYPDPGPFWRALPPPDSGRILDRPVGRFQRPHCLVCSTPLARWTAVEGYARALVTRGSSLCRPCFDRFTPGFGTATIEVSLVIMAIGILSGQQAGTGPRRPSDFLVRSMRALGAATERHGGVNDQLIDTGHLVSIWVPGIAGLHHARRAIQAGQDLSRAIRRDAYLTGWMPGGVVVDTTVGLVGIVGALGTALEFHAADDTTSLAVAIADSTATGQFVVTRRAAAASGLSVDRRAFDVHTIEVDDMAAEDFYVISMEATLWWE